MTKNEAIIEKAVNGAMGKLVIIREIRGKIVVTDKPEFKERILSKKQDLVVFLMREANQYAKLIMKDESLRNAAQIQFNVTRERLYTALVSDYWKKNWEKEKKKHEDEEAKEREKLLSMKIADGQSGSNAESLKQDVIPENKQSE